jgi:phosphopantothenoylcysteine decarboxylase/phosphopantothenate--cysteine ligase
VLAEAPEMDLVIMAAAVADYRPAVAHDRKLRKSDAPLRLDLEPTTDVLVALDGLLAGRPRRPFRVGFAAETEALVEQARAKLRAKGLDLVVANPVPDSFGEGESEALLVDREAVEPLERRPKSDLAEAILDAIAARMPPPALPPDGNPGA